MKVFLLAASLALLWNFSSGILSRPPRSQSTLRLLHVIHRHGDRNPQAEIFWDSNPYANESFYPEGFGQLTNTGKRREYNLGRILRQRYNRFLGDIWNINLLDVRSTDVNRTKMSVELVLAGLFPPRRENIWNPILAWQPIPYNYYPQTKDPVISPWNCETYNSSWLEAYNAPEIQEYLAERYGDAVKIVSENTGIAENDFYSAFLYHDTIKVQNDLRFPQEEWTKKVYPQPLDSMAVDFYYILTNTTSLRRFFAGNFLRKVIADTQNFINGTLSPSSRKMFLYSGHDYNVGPIILSLDAYTLDQTPPYGSAVLFEVHEIRGVYGFKLFYVDYEAGSPQPLTIRRCTHFCPFDEFVSLTEEIVATPEICYKNS